MPAPFEAAHPSVNSVLVLPPLNHPPCGDDGSEEFPSLCRGARMPRTRCHARWVSPFIVIIYCVASGRTERAQRAATPLPIPPFLSPAIDRGSGTFPSSSYSPRGGRKGHLTLSPICLAVTKLGGFPPRWGKPPLRGLWNSLSPEASGVASATSAFFFLVTPGSLSSLDRRRASRAHVVALRLASCPRQSTSYAPSRQCRY